MSFAGAGPTAASLRTAESPSAFADAVLLRPHVLATPLRLVAPPSWISHIPFAFWMVGALAPRTFVELGTHSGNSFSAFAQAVQMNGLGTACYAVDTWTGDAQAGHFDESVFAEWSAFHARHFSSFSRLLRSTFDAACPGFEDGSIDLLHIDGLHTYDAVRHDFETWLPKMSERGVVLMHDINVREAGFGAWRFWEEIRETYPTFTFLHGYGLGVIGTGDELPADVQRLLSAGRGQHADVRVQQFFARLGQSLEREWLLEALQREHARVTVHVAALTEHVQASAAAQAEAERAAAVANANAIDSKSRELQDLEAERDRLRETLTTLAEERAAIEVEAVELRIRAATAVREQRAAAQALVTATHELHHGRGHATRHRASARRAGWPVASALVKVRSARSALAVARLAAAPRSLRELYRIAHCGLFDERYYAGRYEDVRRSGFPALLHYLRAGAREGRSPHPLFDGEFYRARQQDVRASGANPLLHYVRAGASESQRDPHPLFSTAYYLKQHPELPALGHNPLLHYLESAPHDNESPHPLFDAAYYLEQNHDVARDGVLPLLHFAERGGRQGRSPHPLFDTAFYLQQNADVRATGHNPLAHYLEHVPGEDRDPHPLFDSSFYLDAAPELVTLGVNPLLHFVEHGWREGRRPNPAFDPLWYLETNPDVAASGQNPLEHFVRTGWREGRDPCRELSIADYVAAHPDIAASGTNPLLHYLLHGKREGRAVSTSQSRTRRLLPPRAVTLQVSGTAQGAPAAAGPTIVCATHVIPYPPRAGNEYRLLRLLEWLRSQGYKIVLLLAPLPGETVSAGQLAAMAERVGNVAVCGRDGQVTYTFTSCDDILRDLHGQRTQNYAAWLGEGGRVPPREQELTRIEWTYCHDTLVEVARHAIGRLGQTALLVQYVWMTRLLQLVDDVVPGILDTIDMYSTKASKVLQFGASDVALSDHEEAVRLSRADLVLAIQDRERALMQALTTADVITAGVDFDLIAATPPPEPHTVLLVGSGNELNRIGLQDFLRFAWPAVLARVPEASLIVAGRVGQYVPDRAMRVQSLGTVDDVSALYARARVVVNPAAAGTGLKIKTVEALTHNRPIVTWPNGFDGVPDVLRGEHPLPEDWLDFADLVVAHLQAPNCGLDLETQAAVRAFVSPAAAYAQLGDHLVRLFGNNRAPQAS